MVRTYFFIYYIIGGVAGAGLERNSLIELRRVFEMYNLRYFALFKPAAILCY